ncbi:olfactory receptor 10A3-like [Leptodactylus fuscus]|uniref:olfactory receptor 10A3-like n=1 Tax=Leptodactylus fuscus TaxID=238119 RepID=UPI003F4EE766
MNNDNQSFITEFIILGFPDVRGYKATALFMFILMAYILTLMINAMVMVLVSIKSQLHSPMYFFLQQLSFVESSFLTVIVPKMLQVVWLEGATISVGGCLTQFYMYGAMACTECYILTVMAYDRYLAICNPLQYHTIMNTRFQRLLVIYSWILSFLLPQITLQFLCQLHFCGPNVIDHFFCDLVPFVELTCTYKAELQLEILVVSFPILAIPFMLVIISYICVFRTIFGISSTTGWKKTFSTCSSHLIVVIMYFGTLNAIYMVPANGYTLPVHKSMAFLYIVVTPLFNPVIYCLRNQEMRAVLVKLFGKK